MPLVEVEVDLRDIDTDLLLDHVRAEWTAFDILEQIAEDLDVGDLRQHFDVVDGEVHRDIVAELEATVKLLKGNID